MLLPKLRIDGIFLPILLLFATFATPTPSPAPVPSVVTIYTWPLDAPSPSPLASILLSKLQSQSQSPASSDFSASLESFTTPLTLKDGDVIRIGLFDAASKSWNGVATSSKSLAPGLRKRISLHTDNAGNVHHIGFSASAMVAGEDEHVTVQVVPMTAGPQPLLNKPVVLNVEGKLEKPDAEESKSFLQKYWWAIALFLLLQVLVGGGGKE